jgi:hypothetical protein
MPMDMGNIGAGATPGYDDRGNPGYYVPDPRQIRSATERAADVQEAIANADQRIADLKGSLITANDQILKAQQDPLGAIQKAAAVDADLTASEAEKAAAANRIESAIAAVRRANEERDRIVNREIPDAQKQRDRLANRDLRDANEALDDATKGRFRSAERAPQTSASRPSLAGVRSGQPLGAPIAGDFGLSGGLPGLAENATNLLGNLAFAPVLGALSGVSAAADPYGMTQGASGLIGLAATSGMGVGAPGMGAAMPPGLGNLFGGPTGAAPGPAATSVGGVAPSASGGAGFGGLGGLPMQALQGAAASLDMLAPGASVAANIGIQLSNRAIAQAGKAGGLLVGGLLETFLPANSQLADPSKSWFGRIAAGVAGAKPALPNMAGQPVNPTTAPPGGAGAAPAPSGGGVTVNYTNNQATEDRAGADLTNHLTAMNAAPGM